MNKYIKLIIFSILSCSIHGNSQNATLLQTDVTNKTLAVVSEVLVSLGFTVICECYDVSDLYVPLIQDTRLGDGRGKSLITELKKLENYVVSLPKENVIIINSTKTTIWDDLEVVVLEKRNWGGIYDIIPDALWKAKWYWMPFCGVNLIESEEDIEVAQEGKCGDLLPQILHQVGVNFFALCEKGGKNSVTREGVRAVALGYALDLNLGPVPIITFK
jgi:hypothetical protein